MLYERAASAGTEVPESEWPLVDTALVGPGYFEAMGTRMLRGRSFRDADAGRAVAVVNRTLAARLWPGAEARGQLLRLAGSEAVLTVVGVVADGRYRSLVEPPRPFLFQSLLGTHRRTAHAGEVSLGARTLIVRSRGGESSARETLRRALARVAPELTPLRLTTLREATHLPGLLPRAVAAVFGGVAVMALLLVALGVIALGAYAANRRRHEIAVRMALGARPADVRRLLLAEAAGIALLGSTLGAAVSAPAARTLASVLATGQPLAARWLVATLLLTALVAAAALVPARRAALEDPLRSLRDH